MEFLRGPQKADPIVRRVDRTAGPNPFLEEGWLSESYESGDTMSVIVAGGWEERQKLRRAGKGEPLEPAFDDNGDAIMHMVLVGDAATVETQLRRAADYLGIGVSVETVPVLNSRGNPVKGQVEVKYRGKERKQRREDEEE